MKDRTLVYMTFRDSAVSLRTVSRSRKSPHRFYIPCQELEGLETGSTILVQDIHSFAKLHRDAYAGSHYPSLWRNDGMPAPKQAFCLEDAFHRQFRQAVADCVQKQEKFTCRFSKRHHPA